MRIKAALRPRLLVVLALALVVGGALHLFRDTQKVEITAYFSSTEGLYEGDDVKVLGVKVGRVTEVEAQGDRVKVTLEVTHGQPVPAGASAVMQLEPVWSSGPTMADGDVIELQDTAIPVSFDDVKRQLTDLSQVLGPQADDGPAPLAEAVRSIRRSLKDGNAQELRGSLAALRGAADDLSDDSSDLFRTIENLNTFTKNLAVNDAAVRGFSEELAAVGAVLADNRTVLTSAVSGLRSALRETDGFLSDNRRRIRRTTRSAADLTAAVADRSNELAGALHVAPTALINLHHIIENQAITGRATLSHLDSVAQLVCGAVLGVGGTEQACRSALEPLLGVAGLLPIDRSEPTPPAQQGTPTPQAPSDSGGGVLDGLLDGPLGELLGGLLGTKGGTS